MSISDVQSGAGGKLPEEVVRRVIWEFLKGLPQTNDVLQGCARLTKEYWVQTKFWKEVDAARRRSELAESILES